MNESEKEMLEKYRKLTPENRAVAESSINIAVAVQENTKKELSRPAPQEKGHKSA